MRYFATLPLFIKKYFSSILQQNETSLSFYRLILSFLLNFKQILLQLFFKMKDVQFKYGVKYNNFVRFSSTLFVRCLLKMAVVLFQQNVDSKIAAGNVRK